MDDIKNVLYSVIPLILIILFSWLFGLLGSKMKKPKEETDASLKVGSEDQPIDIFGEMREEGDQIPAGQGSLRVTDRRATIDTGAWRARESPGGPRVTPKPITPKWWGA